MVQQAGSSGGQHTQHSSMLIINQPSTQVVSGALPTLSAARSASLSVPSMKTASRPAPLGSCSQRQGRACCVSNSGEGYNCRRHSCSATAGVPTAHTKHTVTTTVAHQHTHLDAAGAVRRGCHCQLHDCHSVGQRVSGQRLCGCHHVDAHLLQAAQGTPCTRVAAAGKLVHQHGVCGVEKEEC